MKQISFFAEENRLQKLSKLGDCLERLKIIDWESFRPIIASVLIRERKSNAGRPPYDCILLFKTSRITALFCRIPCNFGAKSSEKYMKFEFGMRFAASISFFDI